MLAKISDRDVFASPAAIACAVSQRDRFVAFALQNGAILAPVSEQNIYSSEQTLLQQNRLSFVGAKISDRDVFASPAAIACAVSQRDRFVAFALQNGAILAPVRWCIEKTKTYYMVGWDNVALHNVYWSSVGRININPTETYPSLIGQLVNIRNIGFL